MNCQPDKMQLNTCVHGLYLWACDGSGETLRKACPDAGAQDDKLSTFPAQRFVHKGAPIHMSPLLKTKDGVVEVSLQELFEPSREKIIRSLWTEGITIPRPTVPSRRCGILFRWGSCWVGMHYTPRHQRLCINLVPFVTVWFIKKGGTPP